MLQPQSSDHQIDLSRETVGASPNLVAVPKDKITFLLEALDSREKRFRVEFLGCVDSKRGGLKELSIAMESGQWYRVQRVPEEVSQEILRVLQAASSKESISKPEIVDVLRTLQQIFIAQPNLKVVDLTTSIIKALEIGSLPDLPIVPNLIQKHLVEQAIELGKAGNLMERLESFGENGFVVLRALHDAGVANLNTALLEVMDEPEIRALSWFRHLDAALLKGLVDYCIGNTKFSLSYQVDTQNLRRILRALDHVSESASHETRSYIIQTLLDNELLEELFYVFLPFYASKPDWLSEIAKELVDFKPVVRGGYADATILEHTCSFPLDLRITLADAIIERGGEDSLHRAKAEFWQGIDVSKMALKLIQKDGFETHRSWLLDPKFAPLNAEVAKLVCDNGGWHFVSRHLERFRGLSPEQFYDLPVSAMFTNLRSFRWSSESFSALIDRAFRSGSTYQLLENLDRIPEKLLAMVEDSHHLISYRQRLGIPLPRFFHAYRIVYNRSGEMEALAFAKDVLDFLNVLVSSKPQTDLYSRFAQPYYKDLIDYTFPNHSSSSTTFSRNELCPDRSEDIAAFKVRPVYKTMLTEGLHMKLRADVTRDLIAETRVTEPIRVVQTEFSVLRFDKKRMLVALDEKIAACANEPIKDLKTREEKLYILILESLAGRCEGTIVKDLLLAYHFAVREDIAGYLSGTRDRASSAPSPEYAHLLFLREFFADEIRDTAEVICRQADKSRKVSRAMLGYFAVIDSKTRDQAKQERVNRAQIDKLGATEKFQDRLIEKLNSKIEKEKKYKAVAGMITSELKRVANALEAQTGEVHNPEELNLVNLAGLFAKNEPKPGAGKNTFDARLFKAYVSDAMVGLFRPEVSIIDAELQKFAPSQSDSRGAKTLECFITKNHTSAHARGVAGICVAGDNPREGSKERDSMWNLPNFFQMVLRDAETKRCEGVVLLHHYTEFGRRILTASFQPTSTLVFKVDGAELFRGVLGCLIEFANENGFSMITCSKNHGIRTNRTGTEFEIAIDRRIREIGKSYVLSKPQEFSVAYSYRQQDLDVLWERELTLSNVMGMPGRLIKKLGRLFPGDRVEQEEEW